MKNLMKNLDINFKNNTMYTRDDTGEDLRPELDIEDIRLREHNSSPYSVKITRPDGTLFYISGQSLRDNTYNSRNNTYTKKPEVSIDKVSLKVLDLPFSS